VRWSLRALSSLSPPLATRVASELFCHPHRKPRPSTESEWLESATPFRLRAGGQTLAAWSWGDGPTILLHHGWGGRGAQLGALAEPLARAGYGVVTYDAVAHGDSPGRHNTLIDMSRTLVDASRVLGGLHGIVTHSLGGMAASLAMQRGMKVQRAVFISPPGEMLFYSRLFCDELGFTENVHQRMLRGFETTYDMRWRDLTAEAVSKDQTTPLLIIQDTDDLDVPRDEALRMHRAWPGSEWMETSGLGHRAILVDPEVVSACVRFLGPIARAGECGTLDLRSSVASSP
jgi:pimeloyl-ACP methyl ester carboxylesterase